MLFLPSRPAFAPTFFLFSLKTDAAPFPFLCNRPVSFLATVLFLRGGEVSGRNLPPSFLSRSLHQPAFLNCLFHEEGTPGGVPSELIVSFFPHACRVIPPSGEPRPPGTAATFFFSRIAFLFPPRHHFPPPPFENLSNFSAMPPPSD